MDNFVGEIRAFGFGLTPRGWTPCNGQLLPITSNQALFALLGTAFGGDGKTTFGLPNLQGRTSVSCGRDPFGNTYTLGAAGGEEQHVLSVAETPPHTHTVGVSNSPSGPQSTPSTSTVLGVGSGPGGEALQVYGTGGAKGALASQTVGGQGSGQGHENRMPYLAVNYCIALTGIFPTRP